MLDDDKTNITSAVSETSSAVFASWFVFQCTNAVSIDQTGTEAMQFSGNLAADPAAPAVSAACSIGGSSPAPQPEIIVTLADNKPSNVVEERAKKVYDKYDKNHEKVSKEGSSLLILDEEAKSLMKEIVDSSLSRRELIKAIETLKTQVENTSESALSLRRKKTN